MGHIRKIVGSGPGRTVFNIIVSGHVFGDDGDAVGGVLGEEICGGETGHSSAIMRVSERDIQGPGEDGIPQNHDIVLRHGGCLWREERTVRWIGED